MNAYSSIVYTQPWTTSVESSFVQTNDGSAYAVRIAFYALLQSSWIHVFSLLSESDELWRWQNACPQKLEMCIESNMCFLFCGVRLRILIIIN